MNSEIKTVYSETTPATAQFISRSYTIHLYISSRAVSQVHIVYFH